MDTGFEGYVVLKSGGSVLRLLKNFLGLGAVSTAGAAVSFSRDKPFNVRIDVNEVIPHFPTVAADRAAEGLLLFSLNKLSKWKLEWVPPPRRYFPYPRDIFLS